MPIQMLNTPPPYTPLSSSRAVAFTLCLLLLLYGPISDVLANNETYTPRSEEEVEILSLVVASEIKSNDWTKSELVCFSVNGLDPSAALVKSLRQRHPNLRSAAEWRRKFNCGYELELTYTQLDSSQGMKVRSKVLDFRDINSGEAHIVSLLKDGEYSLQKVDGKWSVSSYVTKPL